MKILVAVDGSAYTKHMLAWLAAHDEVLSRAGGTEMTLLTVVPRFPRYASVMDQLDPAPMQQEMSEQVLAPLRAFCAQQPWKVAFTHRVGDPASCIAQEATEGGYDLVLLGSHGHTALANLVMGSVATGVMARCRAPVLIIR